MRLKVYNPKEMEDNFVAKLRDTDSHGGGIELYVVDANGREQNLLILANDGKLKLHNSVPSTIGFDVDEKNTLQPYWYYGYGDGWKPVQRKYGE